MNKITKIFIFLFVIIFIGIFYLSTIGIETNKFNQLIKNKFSEINKKIELELNDVKIILDIKNFNVAIKTYGPNLLIGSKKIQLEKINTSFSINSFIKKDFAVKKLKISTKKNEIRDIVALLRAYKNSPQLFILNQVIKDGDLIAEINLNFNDDGEIKNNFIINGFVKKAKIHILSEELDNVEFDFTIKNKITLLKNTEFIFEEVKLSSKKIEIENKNNFFLVTGDISNSLTKINLKVLSKYLNNNLNNFNLSNLNLSTENAISFKINKKLKFLDYSIKSKFFLKNIILKKKIDLLKDYLPSYSDIIEFQDHNINLEINKNNITAKGEGKFLINENYDIINYHLTNKNNNYSIKTKINFKKNPLIFKLLNYKKIKDKDSFLDIEFLIKKNNFIYFKNILFKEAENKLSLKNLNLDDNFKIISMDNVNINFLNDSNKKNNISIKKNKKNYEITGKSFDGSNLINNILDNNTDTDISNNLNNFNSKIIIDISKFYLDDINFINGLNGEANFINDKLSDLYLRSNFPDKKKINLTIKTNENNERVTTFTSDYAEPFVGKYKFIKGFKGGKLDFYSIKKNRKSQSQIKIYNFKLNELPALTKILTLASLQGIADLLTGEGIRFNEFEMDFTTEDKYMTIEEVYAIGPAISILMEGYIDKNNLVSLRGTLVPATTLNKVVGSIPILGNILVGKKTGEGVFGVSFKIKGKQKKLKTSVNPVKTLTPRFITRTLEKIKKSN